jgi:hypothetical protein
MHLPLENAGIFRNFKSYLKFVKIYEINRVNFRDFQKFPPQGRKFLKIARSDPWSEGIFSQISNTI